MSLYSDNDGNVQRAPEFHTIQIELANKMKKNQRTALHPYD